MTSVLVTSVLKSKRSILILAVKSRKSVNHLHCCVSGDRKCLDLLEEILHLHGLDTWIIHVLQKTVLFSACHILRLIQSMPCDLICVCCVVGFVHIGTQLVLGNFTRLPLYL